MCKPCSHTLEYQTPSYVAMGVGASGHDDAGTAAAKKIASSALQGHGRKGDAEQSSTCTLQEQ